MDQTRPNGLGLQDRPRTCWRWYVGLEVWSKNLSHQLPPWLRPSRSLKGDYNQKSLRPTGLNYFSQYLCVWWYTLLPNVLIILYIYDSSRTFTIKVNPFPSLFLALLLLLTPSFFSLNFVHQFWQQFSHSNLVTFKLHQAKSLKCTNSNRQPCDGNCRSVLETSRKLHLLS